MYLFVRQARLSGRREQEAMALAVHLAEYCTQLTGVQLTLWANVYSQDVGTLVFASVHPDLTSLETTFDKLNVDNEFHDLSSKAQDFILPGSIADAAWEILHPQAEAQSTREVNYTFAVEATARPGKLIAAVETGIELCGMMEEICGIPAEFAVDEAGGYGRLLLIQQFMDAAEYERAQDALIAEQRFRDAIDQKVADVMLVETATRRLYRRIV